MTILKDINHLIEEAGEGNPIITAAAGAYALKNPISAILHPLDTYHKFSLARTGLSAAQLALSAKNHRAQIQPMQRPSYVY